MSNPSVMTPCSVTWRGDQPTSNRYNDIYHSMDGDREVRRIFLEPGEANRLFTHIHNPYVGEIGFGTGLNFAVLAQQFLELSSENAHLHFISFEAEPFSQTEFRALSARRATRLPIYQELAANYPPLITGWHRRHLCDERVTLSVYFGEAEVGLADLVAQQRQNIHLWLLDGFDPKQNPSAWHPHLLNRIATTCGQGSCLTTFTVSGDVRRQLQQLNFRIEKIDQRPHKRHSLKAKMPGEYSNQKTPSPITIIGAGFAGASTARALARRGIMVNVYEANTLASATSAIPCALLHPRLLTDQSREALTRVHTYLYAQALASASPACTISGVLQRPGPNADKYRLQEIIEQYSASGDWLSPALNKSGESDGVLYPGACVVNGPDQAKQLISHPLISLHCGERVADLEHLKGITVIANAMQSREFGICRYIEQSEVVGQIDWVTTEHRSRIPVIADGYQIPEGTSLITGATYEHTPWPEGEATQHNLRHLKSGYQWLKCFRGSRSVSSDRQPVIGALYDRHHKPIEKRYVTTAHGSAGSSSSLWAGEILASQIIGEVTPATVELLAEVSPLRFRLRQSRRGYRHGASH